MGARPMGRLIQSTIKTPLADEVLFGRLKNGGAVKVIVKTDDIGLAEPRLRISRGPGEAEAREGRRQTRPRAKPKAKSASSKPKKAVKPKGSGGNGGGGVRTVPKVPLVRA